MSFSGFQPRAQIQNYTMIPNEFFDEALEQINSLAELKVILAIFRKTYGWVDKVENGVVVYKVEDEISYSQFAQITGLSDVSISEGIKRSVEHGFVEKVKEGGLHKGCSAYKISQRGDFKQGNTERETRNLNNVNTPPKISENYATDKDLLLMDLVGVKNVPLAELNGKNASSVVEKTVKKTTFRDKRYENWNCNDVLAYFGSKYREVFGIPYAVFSAKDRGLAKRLLENGNLGARDIVDAINYYLLNYKTLRGLPEGFPSWAVFYGWRNTIFPAALLGEDAGAGKSTANLSVREYRAVENKWVPNSWE